MSNTSYIVRLKDDKDTYILHFDSPHMVNLKKKYGIIEDEFTAIHTVSDYDRKRHILKVLETIKHYFGPHCVVEIEHIVDYSDQKIFSNYVLDTGELQLIIF